MHNKFPLSFVILALYTVLGVAPAAFAQSQNFQAGQVRIFQAVGEVAAVDLDTHTTRTLKRGDTVTEGHMVATGDNSSAVLLFSNGSSVSLGEKTHLNIDQFKQKPYDKAKGSFMILTEDPSESITSLLLNHGEVLGNVKPLQPRSSFEVSTPLGTAGIKGTKFYVAFGIDEKTGKYVMKIGNIKGQVYVETTTNAVISFDGKDTTTAEFSPNQLTNVQDVPAQSVVTIEAGQIPIAAMLNMLYSISAITNINLELLNDGFAISDGMAYRITPRGEHIEIGNDQVPPALLKALSRQTLLRMQQATGIEGSGQLTPLNFDRIISAGQSYMMDTNGNLVEINPQLLPAELNQSMSLESLEKLIRPIIDAMRNNTMPKIEQNDTYDDFTQNPSLQQLATQLQQTLNPQDGPFLPSGPQQPGTSQGDGTSSPQEATIPDNNNETNPVLQNVETPETIIQSP